ncbi:MAG: hypothetical protein JXQ68_02320 [Campylobacterales bacterium]|nr:hypothetical protein [Campylobacterales bacterium]
MKEYLPIAIIIFAIFALIFLGALYSPTFDEQKGFLELFMLLGGLLFIFSVLAVAVTLGFSSFAFFLTIFLVAVMLLFGIEAVFLMGGAIYILWGLIFTMQLLLFDHNVKASKEWFQKRYTKKSFEIEFFAFCPLLTLAYILLEYLPALISKESVLSFSPKRIQEKMNNFLIK